MCVTVCLWISYFESIFLFSNPWKLPKKKRLLNFSRTQMKKTQLSNRTDKIVLAKPFHTEHPRQWTIAKFCIEKCIHKNHIFSIIVKGSILAKAFNFELRFPYLWWVFVSKLNFVVRYLCLRVLVGQYLTTHDICLLSLKLIVTKLFKNKTWSLF